MDLFDTDDDLGASTVSRYAPERVHRLEGRIAELEAKLQALREAAREVVDKLNMYDPPFDWDALAALLKEGGDE